MQQRKEGEMKCSLNHHHKVKKCGPLWRQVRSYRAKKIPQLRASRNRELACATRSPTLWFTQLCTTSHDAVYSGRLYKVKWYTIDFYSKITFMCYDFISFIRVSKGPYLGTNKCKWESEQEEKGDDRLGYGASHSAQSFCTANTVIAHISLARGVMLFFFFFFNILARFAQPRSGSIKFF